MTIEDELRDVRTETDVQGVFNVDLDVALNLVHMFKLSLAKRLEERDFFEGNVDDIIAELRR